MIPIKAVKKIREDLQFTHLVLYGIDETGRQHICTHGKSKADARESAEAGNSLKKALKWPEDLCNSKPLERICKNCEFWKVRNYHYSERVPQYCEGNCYYSLIPASRIENDPACCHFEPNR